MVTKGSLRSHTFTTSKTARYFTLGPDIQSAKGVLIALHGYGQLPEFFLRKFSAVAEAGWAVIAPEGLHRFYLEGAHGRVGASWMTKEDRESDIADYVAYLDQLMTELQPHHSHPVLLGFSQGVATASRWAALGQTSFARLILWAGVFPPDYPWETGWERLNGLPIDIALGTEDPFFGSELMNNTATILQGKSIDHRTHSFEGGHAIKPQLLFRLLEESAP